ncbi:hypothetical protein GQ607_012930 [Colletotrichum asianum]|uniref:Uncharacterized protein n=1 Tax=Colletotrichum asianum TaxID=702518 RepID=A0A8H3W279_9PEZI|nr:hypothetical protein GQ607_012930 [Colletotrichum asianum]
MFPLNTTDLLRQHNQAVIDMTTIARLQRQLKQMELSPQDYTAEGIKDVARSLNDAVDNLKQQQRDEFDSLKSETADLRRRLQMAEIEKTELQTEIDKARHQREKGGLDMSKVASLEDMLTEIEANLWDYDT